MIYGYDFSIKAGASYFKSKQCLNKMTKESKYYLSDEYTDSANPVICLVKFVLSLFLLVHYWATCTFLVCISLG